MATTFEIQQDLLADAELFSSFFDDEAGKRWFVKKIIAHHAAAADVEAASRQSLVKAKTAADALVASREDKPAYVRDGTPDSLVNGLFARAAYAALAVHPTVFLDQDNGALLKFVVDRRVRTIFRMATHVNYSDERDSDAGYFDFPSDAWASSLRSSARQYWRGTGGANNEIWPFVLSASGKLDPVVAVTSLFRFELPATNDKNSVECQTAATMVLLESLLSAADPSTLLTSLNDEGDGYVTLGLPDGVVRLGPGGVAAGGPAVLAEPAATGTNKVSVAPPLAGDLPAFTLIANDGFTQAVTVQVRPAPDTQSLPIRTSALPLAPTTVTLNETLTHDFARGSLVAFAGIPLFHFLNDRRPDKALFEQGLVPVDDLQPGDVVHIMGHPLTRVRIPTSALGGERCVIVHPWDRPDLVRVTGHGIGLSSILGVVFDMIQVTNRLLSISRRVLERCLDPGLTSDPADSGVVPTPGTSAREKALEARIKETIGRAVFAPVGSWNANDFFTGTWRIFDFARIDAEDLPFWDQLADFGERYPEHWVLAAQGVIRTTVDGQVRQQQLPPNGFFVFGYWPDVFSAKDETASFAWLPEPENLDKNFIDGNFVAMREGWGSDNGATDLKRRFGIRYYDDQGGVWPAIPLFRPGPANAPAEQTILQYDDLLPQLFSFARDNNEAWVIRPRVSGEAAYLNRLRTIGALPNTP